MRGGEGRGLNHIKIFRSLTFSLENSLLKSLLGVGVEKGGRVGGGESIDIPLCGFFRLCWVLLALRGIEESVLIWSQL
jgi:hypothetical protein